MTCTLIKLKISTYKGLINFDTNFDWNLMNIC